MPRFTWGDIGPTDRATAARLAAYYEGLRLVAYQDTGDVWTLGYGHTAGVQPGMTCTHTQAFNWLTADMEAAFRTLDLWVTVPLNHHQRAALADFVFNVGEGKEGVCDGFVWLKDGEPSTLRHLLNARDWQGAADQLPLWNQDNGVVLSGLIHRRASEQQLFLSPI